MHEMWSLFARHSQSSREGERYVQITICIAKKGLFGLKGRPLGSAASWWDGNNQCEVQLFPALSFLCCLSLVFQFKK